MSEAATAFVPGHVTAFFSVHRRDDPARSGSRGAGIALSDGATATVEPAPETRVSLDDSGADRGDGADRDGDAGIEPVERVLDALDVTARVGIDADLPVGAGFGVSGAAALGTALAANRAFDRAHTENDLIRIAHVAEVEADTGLGDVVAQARGGVPIRLEPGAPGNGRLDGVPETARIEYRSFGDLPTADVVSGNTTRLSAAGESALADLGERPTLPTLFALGRTFAREADLLVPEVEGAIGAVLDTGGEATMAMLGRTVVALDTGLSDAGYDAEVCRVHPGGAAPRDSERRS